MNFNPNPSKQAQHVVCSRKSKKLRHPLLFFNDIHVSQSSPQKHIGIILEEQLKFCEHLKILTLKINTTIRILSRSALIIIYKAFVRPHLDSSDIVYDEAYNVFFYQKLELSQYNACLVISRAIRGTSTEKLYQELGLEPIHLRRWFIKTIKIYKNNQPNYLSNCSTKFCLKY